MDNQRPSGPQYSPPPDQEKSRQETREELKQAIQGSNDVLVSATTTLTLFPDTFILDRAKMTVVRRTFFRTAEVVSMRVEDLLNVTASLGPVFGHIKVVSRVWSPEKPYTVGLFWRKDAARVKRIAQGYIIAMQREIDCSALPTPELVKMLDQLGQDDHTGI